MRRRKKLTKLFVPVFDLKKIEPQLLSVMCQVSKQTRKTVSSEDPDFQITFNYELIDDAYCIFQEDWDDSKSIFTNHKDDGIDPDDVSISMYNK